uniref:Uncharacterized protein n=1 Tax=Anguilla anguilla TaxID=7936 RepID=A0A0E9S3L1_ANGAN
MSISQHSVPLKPKIFRKAIWVTVGKEHQDEIVYRLTLKYQLSGNIIRVISYEH